MHDLKERFMRLAQSLGPRPKPPHAGPYYADLYGRGVAAALDLWLMYLVLGDVFRRITAQIYQGIDQSKLDQITHVPDSFVMLDTLWQANVPQLWLLNAAIQLLIMGVLIVGAQCVWGTTPGKWLVGLEIVRYPSLEKPARWRFVLRFLGYIVAAAPLMIGIFWVSFNRERRGWHDYLAGTAVINRRPPAWYWTQVKRLYRRLRGLSPVEKPVGKPPAE